jgi:hypothetical protein
LSIKKHKEKAMKSIRPLRLIAVLVLCLLMVACSGVRPLRKGETVRCPSCGALFTIEDNAEKEKPK